MNIIVVEDETLARNYLVSVVEKTQPESHVIAFAMAKSAIEYVKTAPVDVAFLDIELCEMNGIALAKHLKDLQPDLNIIFVTGFRDYALDAFALHASGYLLKPVSVESVRNEIANLRTLPVSRSNQLRVHTFGNFEVFFHNEPLSFGRSKTKELLAYLIDRRGAGCTTAEISAVLWEDRAYNLSLQKQFQTLVSDLMKTLKKVHAEDILVKRRNHLSVDPSKVDCDYYRFCEGDVPVINSYTGEYMTNYSWAEFTTAVLSQKMQYFRNTL